MERIHQFRQGQLWPIDILRESIKLLAEEISTVLTGAPAKEAKQELITLASDRPLAQHLDMDYLKAAAPEMFERYWSCRLWLGTTHTSEARWLTVLVARAGELVALVAAAFRLPPHTLAEFFGIDPAVIPPDAQAAETAVTGMQQVTHTYQRKKAQPRTRLHLTVTLVKNRLVVHTLRDGASAAASAYTELPLSAATLNTLITVIGQKTPTLDTLSLRQRLDLQRNGLLQKRSFWQTVGAIRKRQRILHLHPRYQQLIGTLLFDTLLAGDVATQFHRANLPTKPLALRLFLDPDYPLLAQLPWELLVEKNGGSAPLTAARRGVEISRTLSHQPAGKSQLELAIPLRVLAIDADPKPNQDETDLVTALQPFAQAKQLHLRALHQPIWADIAAALEDDVYDIVHYRGRGIFGRQCPECHAVCADPQAKQCAGCGTSLQGVPPQGYLLPGIGEQVPPVSAEMFSLALDGSRAELVVLNANGSATISARAIEGCLAAGLVQAGVPAVVALQGEMHRQDRQEFIHRFYLGLVQEESIPAAVNAGRRAIFHRDTPNWFKPVVYLNSRSRFGDLHYVAGMSNAAPVTAVPTTAPPARPTPVPEAARLQQILVTSFDLSGLRELCRYLDINWEELGGSRLSEKAMELIHYLQLRQRLPELIAVGRRLRPNAPWEPA